MDKKYLLLGVIVLALIGFAVVLQTNMTPTTIEESNTTLSNDLPILDPVPPGQSILEVVASSTPEFTTLAVALEVAELSMVLAEPGSYTVFAPTNAAFDALPEGTLDSLLEPENIDQLKEILLYHLVAGEVSGADVISLEAVQTIQGGIISISNKGESEVILNDSASIVGGDIPASNGVVHVIDSVLLPPME